jgi:hypothetical protein
LENDDVPRHTENQRALYDVAQIREILDRDEPVTSTRSVPRLNVDVSAMPPWRMKPVPSTTRARNFNTAPEENSHGD